MAGNIQNQITHGLLNPAAGSQLSGTYYMVGSGYSTVDEILPIGTNQLVAASWLSPGTGAGDLQALMIFANQNCTINTNGTGTADVQTISITGTPTGGNFPLVFGGQAAMIAYNAIASAVQSALQALTSIGSGNVTCSGGPLPGTPVVCTFAGTLATGRQPLMLTGSGGLTGGSSPTVSVAHTTPGLPQDVISVTAGVPILWDTQSILPYPFAGAVTAWYVTCSSAFRLQGRILTF